MVDVRSGLVFVTVLASAGNAAARPKWCGTYQGDSQFNDSDKIEGAKPDDAVRMIVDGSCGKGGDEKKITAGREKWSKALGMNEDDWADSVAFVNSDFRKDVPTNQPVEYSTWTPVMQFNSFEDADPGVIEYIIDALGDKLSESGRLGYLVKCFRNPNPVFWAVCQGDIDLLDRTKIAAELRGDTKHNGGEKMRVRLAVADYDRALQAHTKDVADIKAKDEGYGKLFVKAAEGRKVWPSADPKLIALTAEMDDVRIGGSRKAAAGCIDKTWPAVLAEFAKIPADRFEGMTKEEGFTVAGKAAAVLMSTPNGYLAGIAHASCVGSTKADKLSQGVSDVGAFTPGFRGPRTAAHTTLLGVETDRKSEKIDFAGADRDWLRDWAATGDAYGRGVVAKLDAKGDQTTITFEKKTEVQSQCTGYKSTNRILGIDRSGNVLWDSSCTGYANVTVEVQSKPTTIPTRYLGGLKPGMMAWIENNSVLIAWPNAKAKVPSIVVGAPVKAGK